MDILGWLWWVASMLVTGIPSLIWFLICGWVLTLFQIALLGSSSFPEVRLANCRKLEANQGVRRLFHQLNQGTRRRCGWLHVVVQTVGVVEVKEFGDVNMSKGPIFCGADLREVDRCLRGSNERVCALVLSVAWCWRVPRFRYGKRLTGATWRSAMDRRYDPETPTPPRGVARRSGDAAAARIGQQYVAPSISIPIKFSMDSSWQSTAHGR
jgi:hypothetical protein